LEEIEMTTKEIDQAVGNLWGFLDVFSGKQKPGIGLVDVLAGETTDHEAEDEFHHVEPIDSL
jgi:hypothetical protein